MSEKSLDRRSFLKFSALTGLIGAAAPNAPAVAERQPDGERPSIKPVLMPRILNIRGCAPHSAVEFAVHWVATLLPLEPTVLWRSLGAGHWFHLARYQHLPSLQIPDMFNDPVPSFDQAELPDANDPRLAVVIVAPAMHHRSDPAAASRLEALMLEPANRVWILMDNVIRMKSPLARHYDDQYQDIFCEGGRYYRALCQLPDVLEPLDMRDEFETRPLRMQSLHRKLHGEETEA